jgi:putative hydrolase of the HAD superfamily
MEVVDEICALLGVTRAAFERVWLEEYPARMTGDLEASMRRACAALAGSDTHGAELLRLRIAAHSAMFVPRADAVAALKALRARGLALGLITNCSSEVPALWAASPFAALVDVTVFSAREGIKKPAPAIYERAAARLGVPADECVFVGDGHGGELDGAAATGMTPVLLRPGDTTPPADWAGLAIERLGELPPLVESLGR